MRAEIEELAGEWDALADRAGAPLFLRPGWFSAWWEVYGDGKPFLVTVRRDGRLAGVLPLAWRGRTLDGLSNDRTLAFGPLAEDADVARELGELSAAAKPRRISMSVTDPDDARTCDFLDALATRGFRLASKVDYVAAMVELGESDEPYLEQVGGRRRRELGRRRRRLADLGEVRTDVVGEGADLEATLEEVWSVEGSGWKDERGTGILADPKAHRFYDDAAEWGWRTGRLRLFVLRLDGVPIASYYCLDDPDVRYPLKGGYDPSYARFSPGTLLLADVLTDAHRSGKRRVALGAPPSPFKLRWATDVHEWRLVRAYAPTVEGAIEWAMWAKLRPPLGRLRRVLRGRN